MTLYPLLFNMKLSNSLYWYFRFSIIKIMLHSSFTYTIFNTHPPHTPHTPPPPHKNDIYLPLNSVGEFGTNNWFFCHFLFDCSQPEVFNRSDSSLEVTSAVDVNWLVDCRTLLSLLCIHKHRCFLLSNQRRFSKLLYATLHTLFASLMVINFIINNLWVITVYTKQNRN